MEPVIVYPVGYDSWDDDMTINAAKDGTHNLQGFRRA
jgi:hypothetical protein